MPFWKKPIERNEADDASLNEMNERFVRHAHSFDTTPRPGFKEALKSRLQELRHAHPMQRIQLRTWAMAFPVLVILVVAALVFQPFFGVRQVYAYDNFILKPETADALGAAADSTYLLESREPVSVGDIKGQFSVNVDTSYTLDQVSDKKIRIAFDEPVSEDIVKFTLDTTAAIGDNQTVDRPYAWAFQIKTPFHVTNTLPGNHTTGVPLDTGIEVTFNYENVSANDFDRALTISPEVTGHVEQYRNTFVFVPEALEPQTLYTVTVSGGLGPLGSDETIGDDYVFQFETSAGDVRGYEFGVDDHYIATVPGDVPTVPFHEWDNSDIIYDGNGIPVSNPGTLQPIHVKVYRLDSFDTFVASMKAGMEQDWQSYVTADTIADLSSAPMIEEFDAERTQDNWQNLLAFPHAFESGYYILDFSNTGKRSWALLQSSDVTAYVARATNKTLVWVNSASSGSPIQGAQVGYVDDADQGATDANGIGYVTSKPEQGMIVRVTNGNDGIALPLNAVNIFAGKGGAWLRPRVSQSSQYWSYLYSDRPLYKPTDTIHFWGFIADRATKQHPSQIRIVTPFDESVVDVNADGTYSGTLEAKDVTPSYYDLTAQVGDETVTSRSISIQPYVKPAYTLALTPDKDAVFAGDPIGYSVHGEAFEGTPMKGLVVQVETNAGTQTLTLDDNGNARSSFTVPYTTSNGSDWRYHEYPTGSWMRVSPFRPEEGSIDASAQVMVFGPKVYLETPYDAVDIKDGTGTVKVIARNVQVVNAYDPATFAPTTRANAGVDGKLIEITYTQVEIGTTYDFVRKETVKQYRYDRHENQVSTFHLTTGADGSATYTFPASNPEANYEVQLMARDENGRVDTTSVNVWQRHDYEMSTDTTLQFRNDDAPVDNPWQFKGYNVGETVHLSVEQGGKPFTVPAGGRMLFYQARQGIQQADIVNTNAYQFAFAQEDVPNLFVHGVLFYRDGYLEVGGYWFGNGNSGFAVSYNTDYSKLNVTVSGDKERYRPGDDATVSVHVTDRDGKPVSADVNVNVVDEALYALSPEQVDTLNSLYQWVEDGVEATKVSERLSDAMSGAEGGGGGGRGRVNFKDTAYFTTIKTGTDGNGTATFKLPDDITSWRVTTQAIEPGRLLAGNAQIDLDSSLPFYISPVLRESYLDSDQPVMLIRTNGTDVGLGDTVEYQVSVDGGDAGQTIPATVKDTVRYALPDLADGPHEITIDAKSGSFEDRMTRTVTIVPSRLVKPVISRSLLSQTNQLSGAEQGLTDVTFVDGNKGRFYGPLETIAGTFGDRADESVARVVATELLNETFGETRPIPDMDADAYQDASQGGIRLLPYADPDAVLTAKIAMLQTTPFSNGGMVTYFNARLYNHSQGTAELSALEASQAYAALAALGEPVLGAVQRFSTQSDLGEDEKLYLALAMHFSGDDEGARTIYRQLLKKTKTQLGYTYLPGEDKETTGERTALLAVLAGALGEPGNDAIHDYVTNMDHGNTVLAVEEALYAKESLPHFAAGNAEVAYTLEGERRTQTLENGMSYSILVSPDELAVLDATATKGSVLAVTHYDTAVIDPSAPVDSSISATRTYWVDGKQTTDLHEGQLVKVVINYQVSDFGCPSCQQYQLTDVLPSGLAPATETYGEYYSFDQMFVGDCVDFPTQSWNQRVTFFVSHETDTSGCTPNQIVYYARVVTPGTYQAEQVYIRAVRDPETQNHSDAQTVTITE